MAYLHYIYNSAVQFTVYQFMLFEKRPRVAITWCSV